MKNRLLPHQRAEAERGSGAYLKDIRLLHTLAGSKPWSRGARDTVGEGHKVELEEERELELVLAAQVSALVDRVELELDVLLVGNGVCGSVVLQKT